MIFAVHKKTKEHRITNVMSQPDSEWRYVVTDADGWIPWDGGECPLPDESGCGVKHRDGEVFDSTFAGSRVANDWSHTSNDGDIIAYRPILDEPSEPEAPEWTIGERCIWQLGDVCMGQHVILARDGDTYWIRDDHGGYDMADSEDLLPILTDAQRAEQEASEEMARVMAGALGMASPDWWDASKAIYAAIRDGNIPGIKLEE